VTHLLEKAIAEAKKTSPEVQDAIASRNLAELRDETAWSAAFTNTTEDQWDRVADQVCAEIASGDSE
jgi:hypothetical protein